MVEGGNGGEHGVVLGEVRRGRRDLEIEGEGKKVCWAE